MLGLADNWIDSALEQGRAGTAPTVDALLQMASVELDEIGLKAERLKAALGPYLEALPAELRAAALEQLDACDPIAQRLRAVAGVVGLVRPQLGPLGGVREALESVAGSSAP